MVSDRLSELVIHYGPERHPPMYGALLRSTFFFLTTLGVASAGCATPLPPAAPPPSAPSGVLGEALPEFRRPILQGGIFDSAATSGRVLVVDFFAAYCRPCQRTLPALEALHREQPEVLVLGVSLDDDAVTAWRSIGRHGLTFPVVQDAGRALAGRFRVSELPSAFVVDRDRRIRWVAGPGESPDALARAVAALSRRP